MTGATVLPGCDALIIVSMLGRARPSINCPLARNPSSCGRGPSIGIDVNDLREANDAAACAADRPAARLAAR